MTRDTLERERKILKDAGWSDDDIIDYFKNTVRQSPLDPRPTPLGDPEKPRKMEGDMKKVT